MTHNELNRKMKTELRENLSSLDSSLELWKKRKDIILEKHHFENLRIIAEKNVTGMKLSDAQRQAKTDIHQTLRNSMADIYRMMALGFLGTESPWNPKQYGIKKDRLPFEIKFWREDFPLGVVCRFIHEFVKMFGEEYGIPIADAVRDGLIERELNKGFDIEVPIIKRLQRGEVNLEKFYLYDLIQEDEKELFELITTPFLIDSRKD